MSRFLVTIWSTDPEMTGQALRVDADGWLDALAAARRQLGLGADLRGLSCELDEQGHVRVLDPDAGHAYSVRRRRPQIAGILADAPPDPSEVVGDSIDIEVDEPSDVEAPTGRFEREPSAPAVTSIDRGSPGARLKRLSTATAPLALELDAFDNIDDVTALFNEALNHLTFAIPVRAATILRRDGQQLIIEAAAGDAAVDRRAQQLQLGQGAAGIAAQSGVVLNIVECAAHPEIQGALNYGPPPRCLLCAPIATTGAVPFGAVELVDRTDEVPFDESDFAYVAAVGQALGLRLSQLRRA
ncbi:MAG: hypothetical protein H6707_11200 [Deltaproteobacteria bacterium]|nr:hypothetical protein [Deltaproteobacteria bacterium]